jgi:hypothetical protein
MGVILRPGHAAPTGPIGRDAGEAVDVELVAGMQTAWVRTSDDRYLRMTQ